MKAYLFPGQGAQTITMATELIQRFSPARFIYQAVEEKTGIDLTALTADQLSQTLYSQLAIVTHSIGVLHEELHKISHSSGGHLEELTKDLQLISSQQIGLAGFSLGEYTALYAARILPLASLLTLIQQRSLFMQEAAEKNTGAMYAILGLSDNEVEEIIAPFDNLYAVNYNCPLQLVIAGDSSQLELASKLLLEKGAKRAMKLSVNGAFHSPYMTEAATNLEKFCQTLTFAPAQATLYSNVTGQPINSKTNWAAYLQQHMISSVHFHQEILAMKQNGYDEFLEIGPGKVLTGLVKKILPAK